MVFVDIYTLSDFWASGRNLSIKSIIIINMHFIEAASAIVK